MTAVPTITLNNGVRIPQLGFGTFQIPKDETRETTLAALEAGYRHIDTAQMYGNEKEVGQAVRDSGLDRGDVFVTSKLNNDAHAHDDALAAFDRTMDELGLDHLDLFLVHWPLPGKGDFTETWKAMEEIYGSGRAKAIGVSRLPRGHRLRVPPCRVRRRTVGQLPLIPGESSPADGGGCERPSRRDRLRVRRGRSSGAAPSAARG
ncbi:oxidoreductase [Streptomyces xanthochromogenes]